MMERIINDYTIVTVGGFITVKHWIVYKNYNQNNEEYCGTFFKFKEAKKACLENNFSSAFKGKLY